ncbi:MAG: hypothetical protein ACKO7Y_04220, partial [Candidatus Nitrosotenuis sp.]
MTELDQNQIKILGIIDELAPSIGVIQKRTRLDAQKIEQDVAMLEKNGMISKIHSRGFFGNSKIVLHTSQSGKDELAKHIQNLKDQWGQIIKIAAENGRSSL